MYLELSFDLGAVDSQAAEGACWACGASALTFVDARDDAVNHPTKSGPTCEANSSPFDKTPYFVGTPVLEPAPGEFRLWPRTRLRCLFARECDAPAIARALGAALGLDPMSIEVRPAADVVLANILSGPLCALAPRFASLLRPGGEIVLAGLMQHEVEDVTGAYAPCFDVAPFGESDGWVGLAGRRH